MNEFGVTVAIIVAGLAVLILVTAYTIANLAAPFQGDPWPRRRKLAVVMAVFLAVIWFTACAFGASHGNDPIPK